MEKIVSRKARNESVRFYNQTTLQTFFFIGNSVHGSLLLTFDTHPTTLKEKATIKRKVKTIQGFHSLEKIKWLLIRKKIRLSKAATVTRTIIVVVQFLNYGFYFSMFTPNC